MAITLRSSSTVAAGTRTNTTVNAPTGHAANDVIVVGMECGGSSLVQPTGPAGWTLLGRVTYTDNDPWFVDIALWAKVRDGSSSWTWTHASRSTQAYAWCLTGVDNTNIADATAVTAAGLRVSGTGLTAVAPSLTTVTANAWRLILRGSWDGNAISPPSGWVEDYDAPVIWAGHREEPTPGASGTVSVSAGNSGSQFTWGIIHAAIRPDTGSAPGMGSGSGTVAFTGSGAGKRTPKGSGTGNVAFIGSGTGTNTRRGTGSGTTTFTGTATGRSVRRGTGTGTLAFVGTGTGKRTPKGNGTGVIAWAGTATGSAPDVDGATGSGSGSLAWSGSATGKRTPKSTGSGTTAWTGVGVGKRTPMGTGAGTVAFTGTAIGLAPSIDGASGVGIGSLAWSGSATGKRQPKATGVGTLALVGAATGRTTRAGIGAGSLAFAGTAVGITPGEPTDFEGRILSTRLHLIAASGDLATPTADSALSIPKATGVLT